MARFLVVQALPYTKPVLLAMQVEVTDEASSMSVDIHGRILVNPNFITLVAEECGGLPALAYIILHEWMHYVYSHSERSKTLEKNLGAKLDKRAHGIACDLAINPLIDRLVESLAAENDTSKPKNQQISGNIRSPKGDVVPIRPADFGLDEGTYEQLYHKVYAKIAKIKPGDGEGQPTSGCSPKDPGEDGESPGEKEVREKMGKIGRSEKAQLLRQTSDEAKKCQEKYPGRVPGDLALELDALTEPHKVSWQDQLRCAISFAVANRRGDGDTTYVFTNKKQAGLGWGVDSPVLPGCADTEPNIGIIQDTSGSMWGEPLRAARDEIMGIIKEMGLQRVALVACDADAQKITYVSSFDEVNKAMKGGGGTDMRPGMEAFRKKGFEPVICITDGYIPDPGNDPGYHMIWCIAPGGTDEAVKSSQKAGWANIVYIEPTKR
jgi:predicted metal-dependent peptidase